MQFDDSLETLSDQECRALLGAGTIGRIGVTMRGLPMIFPVNYAVIDGDIVFPFVAGTRLLGGGSDSIVAFEVGASTPPMWSVLAVGRARHVVDDREHAEISGRASPLWPSVDVASYVRIQPELLTGVRAPTV